MDWRNMRQDGAAGCGEAGRDGIIVRTPKVSVTISEVIRQSDPTGRSSGTTNQSLPYATANSNISMRARSWGSGFTAHRSTVASSNSHQRGAGMPRNVTGEGITV